ncbi:MAG: hypothetical protein AB1608_01080 [Thermoproteota archaeon]
MKIQIVCQDKHEAAKLASLIFIKDGKETFISSIINTYDNEVVISLKDKSAHSIVLKSSSEVERFADFIQSVLDNVNQIINTKIIGDLVEIEKS